MKNKVTKSHLLRCGKCVYLVLYILDSKFTFKKICLFICIIWNYKYWTKNYKKKSS
jgi:hypothetical protein